LFQIKVTVPGSRDLHEQILSEAKRLFIEQGYHALSMRQIAEAVGVSKAALYYHFRDKQELFLAILESYLDVIEAILDRVQAEGTTCRQQISALVETILSQPAEQRAIIRLASQEMAQLSAEARQAFNTTYHAKFIDKVEAILKAGVESGELKPIDTGVATWTLLGMMYPYFYPAQSHDMPSSPNVAEQLLEIYLNGMTAPG
jgi:AcrR family transcriptional regulator